MEFQYTARDEQGQTRAGVVAAESIALARDALREDGLFVVSIATRAASRVGRAGRQITFGTPKVRKKDVLMLTSQLSIMVQAGVDLAEALELVADECTNPVLQQVLRDVHSDVSSGVAVSDALRRHASIFGEAYVASIAAGEASGTLGAVLERLVELLKHEIRLLSTIRSVLAYPAVLSLVAFVVVSALIFFVLPQFGQVFADLGQPPPPFTQFLLDLSAFLRTHFLVLAGTGVGSVAVVWKFSGGDGIARYWDGFLLNSRLIRSASQSLLAGRTLRLLGTMLQSGIPLLEGIRLCRASVKNRLFRALFAAMESNVLTGGNIGDVLKRSRFIPSGAAQMVCTAEKTGRLGTVMVTVGEYYEEDGEQQVRDLTKLLEPLIIVVMGVLVAGVVMAVMLPLLDASTAPGH